MADRVSQVRAFERAKGVQSLIGSLAHTQASGLVPVPVEDDEPRDAVRKLQVQIFELTDALAATIQEIEHLRAEVDQPRWRR